MIKISSQQNVNGVTKIYINEKLHLLFKDENLNGLQSWIENDNKFVIEFYFKEGKSIIAEYEDRDLWETILKEIDNL